MELKTLPITTGYCLGCVHQGRGTAQKRMPSLPNADPDRSGRGDGETPRGHACRSEDGSARPREILQFAERRTEGAIQFASFGVPADGVIARWRHHTFLRTGTSCEAASPKD